MKPKLPPKPVGPIEPTELLNESFDKTCDKIKGGDLPSYMDDRLRRIRVADIDALIERRLAGQSQPPKPKMVAPT